MIFFLLGWGCQKADTSVRIAKFKGDKPAAVSFTFDDTNQSAIDAIAPLFDERDLKATFAINCADSYEGWKNIASRGHEIANHSCNHLDLSTIHDNATLEFEINFNYDQIAKNIGIPPITFVHPFDRTNSDVDRVAFERHLFTRIVPRGFCTPKPYGNSPIPEIINATVRNDWLVLAGHGFGDGCCRVDYNQFVDVLDYIKINEQTIWVDTFRNVALYKIERENAVLTQNTEGGEMHLSLRLDMDISLPPPIAWVPLTVVVPVNDAAHDFRIVHSNSGDQESIPFVRGGGALRFELLPGDDVAIIFDQNEKT